MDIFLSYAVFFISAVTVLGYFFCKRREFDFLSLYILSMTLFFLPSFFRLTYDPVLVGYVQPGATFYLVQSIAYWGGLGGVLFKVAFSRISFPALRSLHVVDTAFVYSCLFITLAVLMYLLPLLAFATNKSEALKIFGVWVMLLTSLIPVGFAMAIVLGRLMVAFFFVFFALLLFLYGMRSPLVFLFLGGLMLSLSRHRIALISQWKVLIFGFFFVAFVVIGKAFYGAYLLGGWVGALEWVYNPDFENIWRGAEFLTTSAILNGVIVADFETDFWLVPVSFISALPIPLASFGLSSSIFNDLFQPALYPTIDYGMAYNPWAEAYSWGRLCGVMFYAFLFPFLLVIFEGFWRFNRKNSFGGIFLMMGVLVAFWVHRNSLGSELAYLRNLFFPCLAIWLCSFFVLLFPRRSLQ